MMNPSAAGLWNDPPPPGIEDDGPTAISTLKTDENINHTAPTVKDHYHTRKNDFERLERNHHRKRSRSRSYDRYQSRSKSKDRKRKRHRSRSRGRRHRRSRSRSRGSHRRRYSSSRSRSRSSSYDRHRHKHRRDKRKRSRSRRYSRSRSRSRSGSYRHNRSRRYSRERETYCNPYPPEDVDEKDDDDDDDEPEEVPKELPFKNDGSFLEMFKKMQEEQQKAESSTKTEEVETKKTLPAFGKRRGGRVLKTGLVQKNKTHQQEDVNDVQDPWSIYLKEVKRYKEACCDDDSKTRPLVK